jgi:septal ring factor EnvC (AmiA/AmiB activator)
MDEFEVIQKNIETVSNSISDLEKQRDELEIKMRNLNKIWNELHFKRAQIVSNSSGENKAKMIAVLKSENYER